MENSNMVKSKKIILSIICLVVGVVSFFFLSEYFSNPETWKFVTATLDEKKNTVTALALTSSAASVAISFLPGDAATPLANQISNISSYLVIILSIIYLEKYLLTAIGYIAFKFIVPIVCFGIVFIIWSNLKHLYRIIYKVCLFTVAMLLLIPTSVGITNLVDKTYETSKITTIENSTAIEEVINEEVEVKNGTSASSDNNSFSFSISNTLEKAISALKDAINSLKNSVTNTYDNVTSSVSKAIENVKEKLNQFMEAVAVMLVTSCLIPLLTLLAFKWIVKLILDINIPSSKLIEQKDKIKNSLGKDRSQYLKESKTAEISDN